MSASPPTIKEIAKRLNVSVSTVSRALANNPRIGLGTRLKIQKLAKELHYEPNKQAILFKQKKTQTIGVIVPNIREDFFSEAITGIETVALAHDYSILFGQSYDSFEKEVQMISLMKKQRVDGIIVSLSKETVKYSHVENPSDSTIPIVYFDRVPHLPNINKVFCNIYQGTLELIDWLYKKGCRQIALINGPQKISASKERLHGYIDAISKHKIKVDMRLQENTDFTKEGTIEAMQKLFSLKRKPDAIITFNEYVHLDAVQYAASKNYSINKDILFVSFANLPITEYSAFPPLASIEQFPQQQGAKAMEMLIDIWKTPDNEKARQVEIMPSLIIH